MATTTTTLKTMNGTNVAICIMKLARWKKTLVAKTFWCAISFGTSVETRRRFQSDFMVLLNLDRGIRSLITNPPSTVFGLGSTKWTAGCKASLFSQNMTRQLDALKLQNSRFFCDWMIANIII